MIHSTAIIDPKAEIAADVEIGPYSVIGPDVQIGAGTVIGPHVVIKGPTTIGKENRIFQFSSVGEDCQDKKYAGEPTRLEIGDRNHIRECCTIHRGTVQDQGLTRIGSDNLFMAYVHIAHDCMVGDNNIMANNASLAGHVHMGDGIVMGGFSGAHQFCQLGSYSMAAKFTVIAKDVPAFVMVSGTDKAKAVGMNYEGMRRRGYSKDLINALRKAYKIFYRNGLTLEQALEELTPMVREYPEIKLFVDSIKTSTRGITR